MPTGQAKDGRHGGSGNRRFRYKQMLIEQGVSEKAAHTMAKEKYSDMSAYLKRDNLPITKPITSSELVEMKKSAERQASSTKSPIRGSGSGGMNPIDLEKVPGKRPLKMKHGGMAHKKKKVVKRGTSRRS